MEENMETTLVTHFSYNLLEHVYQVEILDNSKLDKPDARWSDGVIGEYKFTDEECEALRQVGIPLSSFTLAWGQALPKIQSQITGQAPLTKFIDWIATVTA